MTSPAKGHDCDLPAPMALRREDLHGLADSGHFSGRQILACHEAGTTHFLTRRLGKIKTEIALNVLACNISRMVAQIGLPRLPGILRQEHSSFLAQAIKLLL